MTMPPVFGLNGMICIGDKVRCAGSIRVGIVVDIEWRGTECWLEITQPGDSTYCTNTPEIYEVVR